MKVFTTIVIFSVLLMSYTNCSPSFEAINYESSFSGDILDTPDATPSVSNKLESRVEQILNKNCASCHNSEINFAGISKITDLEWLKSSGVVNSVMDSINAERMPPSGRPLNLTELDILNNWYKEKDSYQINTKHSCSQVAATERKTNSNNLWLLSRKIYSNIIIDSLKINVPDIQALPAPFINHGFEKSRESSTVDEFVFSEHLRISEIIAKKATENINVIKKYFSCENYSKDSLSKNCFNKFVTQVIGKLQRRYINSSDLELYNKIYSYNSSDQNSVLKGLEQVIFTALISPQFLYKKTLYNQPSDIEKNYTIAEDLAFHIYESIPDQELLNAAVKGDLIDSEYRLEQIERMLKTQKGQTFFSRYLADYFEVFYLNNYNPDNEITAKIKNDYIAEFNSFVADVMRTNGDLKTLLSMSRTSPSREIANISYGLNIKDTQLINHDPNERAGLLTIPAFLVTTSTTVRNIPPNINRGIFVREKLLCHELGSPPTLDEPVDEKTTNDDGSVLNARQRFERSHLTKKDCASCHSLIDPIGFGLAYYNDFGVLETKDPFTNGPVDKAGYVSYTENSNFDFTDATDMARQLADSKDVANCFVEKTYEYLQGEVFASNNLCSIEKFQKNFESSEGNIFNLVTSVLNDPLRYNID